MPPSVSGKLVVGVAETLRPILAELAGLSDRAAAAELNRRKVATPAGGQWHAQTVARVKARLAPQHEARSAGEGWGAS